MAKRDRSVTDRVGGHVIAIASQKGGAGKTTVCMNLAGGLAARGLRVSVLDLDPQESALRWAAGGQGFPVRVERLESRIGKLDETVARLAGDSDYLLFDCPPSMEHPHTLAGLAQAQAVLVPVVPGPTDLWSTRATQALILRIARDQGRAPRAALVPNRVQRSSLSTDVLSVLEEFALPVLGQGLAQRIAYAQCAVRGVSVFQLGRPARAAQQEVGALVSSVMGLAEAPLM